MSDDEAEEISFQCAWLAYLWGRAALAGVEQQVRRAGVPRAPASAAGRGGCCAQSAAVAGSRGGADRAGCPAPLLAAGGTGPRRLLGVAAGPAAQRARLRRPAPGAAGAAAAGRGAAALAVQARQARGGRQLTGLTGPRRAGLLLGGWSGGGWQGSGAAGARLPGPRGLEAAAAAGARGGIVCSERARRSPMLLMRQAKGAADPVVCNRGGSMLRSTSWGAWDPRPTGPPRSNVHRIDLQAVPCHALRRECKHPSRIGSASVLAPPSLTPCSCPHRSSPRPLQSHPLPPAANHAAAWLAACCAGVQQRLIDSAWMCCISALSASCTWGRGRGSAAASAALPLRCCWPGPQPARARKMRREGGRLRRTSRCLAISVLPSNLFDTSATSKLAPHLRAGPVGLSKQPGGGVATSSGAFAAAAALASGCCCGGGRRDSPAGRVHHRLRASKAASAYRGHREGNCGGFLMRTTSLASSSVSSFSLTASAVIAIVVQLVRARECSCSGGFEQGSPGPRAESARVSGEAPKQARLLSAGRATWVAGRRSRSR
jgi:hypothetical protein